MLIPSTITARRTRRYTSTWYIHPSTHKRDFKPMDGSGRYIFQPPQCQAVNPSRWSTLPPPFTGQTHDDVRTSAVVQRLGDRRQAAPFPKEPGQRVVDNALVTSVLSQCGCHSNSESPRSSYGCFGLSIRLSTKSECSSTNQTSKVYGVGSAEERR
jgi:hypothetical protein